MRKMTKRLLTMLMVIAITLSIVAPLGALAAEPDVEKGTINVTVARSASSVALNTRMTFTPTATGGTAPYSYKYVLYNGNTRVTSSAWRAESNKRFVYTPKTVGSYRVQLTVIDALGATATVWGPYINAGTSLTVKAGRNVASANLNSVIRFTPTVTGGVAPYTYQFDLYRGDTRIAGSAWRPESNKRFNYTPTVAGQYRVSLVVKDKTGSTAAAYSAYIAVGVPLTASVKTSTTSAAPGSKITFTPTATGGASPYTYKYILYKGSDYVTSSAWRPESNKAFVYTPDSTGKYRVYITVKDGSGATKSVYSSYVTVAQPIVASVTRSAASVAIGKKMTFTPTASGGTAPYTYKYALYNGSTAVTSSAWRPESNKAFVYTPTAAGKYRVKLTVKDSLGASKSVYSSYVTVPLKVTAKPGSTTGAIGSKMTFTPTASGGTAPYTYKYIIYNGSTAVTSSAWRPESSKAFVYTPTAAGKYRVQLTVKDAKGLTGTAYSVYVTVPLKVTAKPGSTAGNVGTKMTFTPTATGGTAPYTYQYVLYKDGTRLTSSAWRPESNKAFVYTPTAAGKYRVQVTVKDAKGLTGTAYSSYVTVVNSTYRALLIGQRYSENNRLNATINDRNALAAVLSKMTKTPYAVTLAQDLTGSGILNAIPTTFAGATDNDVSLFFYTGHGLNDSRAEYHGALCGYDIDGGSYSSIVTATQLRTALDQVKGKKIVIIDACHSGALIGKSTQRAIEQANKDYVESFISAFSGGSRSNLAASNYYVLVAARSDQSSWEGTHYGPWTGYFTYHLTMGSGYNEATSTWNGNLLADVNNNKQLTLDELYDYVYSRAMGPYNSSYYQYAQVYPTNSSQVVYGMN